MSRQFAISETYAGGVAARGEVLGMIAADRIPFIGYHMPPPAVGCMEAKGRASGGVPAWVQLNL